MNNPSPLIPQGSMLEQKARSRSRIRTAFFCVLAIHVIPITIALLMQGCKKPPEQETAVNTNDLGAVPPMDAVPPGPELGAATNTHDIAPPPTDLTVPTPAMQEYAVMKGDTLSTIAGKFHITVPALMAANPGVEPTKLQINQKLHIPPPTVATPSSPATPSGEVNAGGEQVYSVKSGDTLSKIATDHGVTLRALRAANPKLTTDKIKVGDKIVIPKSTAPAAPSAPTPAPAPTTSAPRTAPSRA